MTHARQVSGGITSLRIEVDDADPEDLVMRRLPTCLAALMATTSLAFAVAPATENAADLATVPYAVTDPAGDANATNGQGFQDVDSVSTDPAQVATADILGGRVTTLFTQVTGDDGLVDHEVTGLEFRTALSAEPTDTSAPVLHRFNVTAGGCPIFVQAYGGANSSPASFRLNGASCGIDDPALSFETLTGDWITSSWDAEHDELVVTIEFDGADPRVTELLPTEGWLQVDGLESRGNNVLVVAPVYDLTDSGFAEIGTDVPADEEPTDGGDGDTGDSGFYADGHVGGDGNDVPRDTRATCGRHSGGGVGSTATQGSDRTGAGPDSLTLGMHAPATGAAPLPTTSFEHSRDLYWRAVTEGCGETVLGRSDVDVEFRDDKYDPSSAGQVCKELASRSFLLLGAGGTDQIQRCGQLAHVDMFPYLSVGVTEAGLDGNPWYFGSTMSFYEQGGLLAEYVAANPDGNRVLGTGARIGSIVTDTPNFDDALQGWHEGLAANGLQSQTTFRHAKGDTSWYAAAAEEFKQQEVEVVYFLSSPVDLIQFANTANERFGYNPLYVGVASDTSLDAVLHGGCGEPGRTIDGGIWLSGTPALDAAPTAFLDAAQQYGAPDDDIALRLWAFAEQQRELLEGYAEVFGHDLTREDFRAFVDDGATADDGTFPAASWSPSDHFPSEAMHVVQANCERQQHVTLHVDAAGF